LNLSKRTPRPSGYGKLPSINDLLKFPFAALRFHKNQLEEDDDAEDLMQSSVLGWDAGYKKILDFKANLFQVPFN